jgi:hypothetical protein
MVHGFEQTNAPWTFFTLLGIGVFCGGMLTLFISSNMPTLDKPRRNGVDPPR